MRKVVDHLPLVVGGGPLPEEGKVYRVGPGMMDIGGGSLAWAVGRRVIVAYIETDLPTGPRGTDRPSRVLEATFVTRGHKLAKHWISVWDATEAD